MAAAANADIVPLPAMGFVHYDPNGNSPDPAPSNGTLSSQLLSVDLRR